MRTYLLTLLLLGVPAAVFAQPEAGGPPPNVRMHIGPVYLNPTMSLNNAGVDTNVFNTTTNPQQDFTITFSPTSDIWLRVGPSWFQTTIREDIVWFNKFASERAANNTYNLKWVIPINRLTFTPTAMFLNTRQRPGFEIDARSQRSELNYGLAVEIQALSKTFFGVRANRTTTNFDQAAEFLGVSLHDELNRKVTNEGVTVRHRLTPLTDISAEIALEQDRFDFDPLRNSDSKSITASIKFDPAALIKGGATFGYRDFTPASSSLPGYQGTTAAVDMSYVLFGITKFAGTVTRDVQYSYDINQPYYVQTGASASVSQQIFGPLDVIVRGGLQRLNYQDRTGAAVAVSNRVDHVQTFGAGIGYHFGRDTRFGFNIDQNRRNSAVDLREYKGLTYGFAVTYGS